MLDIKKNIMDCVCDSDRGPSNLSGLESDNEGVVVDRVGDLLLVVSEPEELSPFADNGYEVVVLEKERSRNSAGCKDFRMGQLVTS